MSLDGTPVLILGCYDLSVCSTSWRATPVWKQTAVSQFRALAAQHKPVAVLHHPHMTVTIGTWARHWQSLLKELPFVTDYLGASAYTHSDSGWDKRNTLAEVLRATKRGEILNVMVRLSCDW